MIQVILDLPTSLSAAIFCQWLDLKAVCLTDSACCEKSKRKPFLNLLQSEECIGQFYANSNEQLVWINRRSLKSNGFRMGNIFSEEECLRFLERSGHCVRTIFQTWLASKGGSLHIIEKHCHNLTTLYSTPRNQKGSYMELLSVNPCLVELLLSCCDPFAVSELSLPNLKYLRLDGPAFDDATCLMFTKASPRLSFLSLTLTSVTANGFIEAMHFCPQVQFLGPPNLPDIDNVLLRIAPKCVHIEHICLTDCKSLSDTGIAALAQNIQALRSVLFTYNHRITNACLQSLSEYQSHTLEILIMEESIYHRENYINDLDLFNSEAVAIFREKCSKLSVFDWRRALYFFGEFYYAELVTLVVTSDRVTTLTLPRVDNTILHTIALHCTQLRVLKLYITDSANIDACSDAAILAVAQQCHHLHTIIVLKPQDQRARLLELLMPYPRITVAENEYLLPSYSLDGLYRDSQ